MGGRGHRGGNGGSAMSTAGEPVIGADLYRMLSELCDAARLHASVSRNYHAAALYVAIEALRVQAENVGSAVSVYIQPRAS